MTLDDNISQKSGLLRAESAIINTLLYYEVFKHPLRKAEILTFSNYPFTIQTLEANLLRLQQRNLIKITNQFYYVNLSEQQVIRRIEAEKHFVRRIRTARFFCRIIAAFPFVRGICLSGSISKGVMYPKSDIDYFIITAPNRLWVAKLLLTLFKKTVLFNSYYNFCINYFIDNQHLVIKERNLFTATELATLMPEYGYEEYSKLLQNNPWLLDYFPNFKPRSNNVKLRKNSFIKTVGEWSLNGRGGRFLNRWFMNLVRTKYVNKYGKQYSAEELDLMFRSQPYVAKVHPSNYQKRLAERLVVVQQRFLATPAILNAPKEAVKKL